jgi:hypothetical protein
LLARALRGRVGDDPWRRARVAHLVDLGQVRQAAKQRLLVGFSGQGIFHEAERLRQGVQALLRGVGRRLGGPRLRPGPRHRQQTDTDEASADDAERFARHGSPLASGAASARR